jgi:hypothetical protein
MNFSGDVELNERHWQLIGGNIMQSEASSGFVFLKIVVHITDMYLKQHLLDTEELCIKASYSHENMHLTLDKDLWQSKV